MLTSDVQNGVEGDKDVGKVQVGIGEVQLTRKAETSNDSPKDKKDGASKSVMLSYLLLSESSSKR